MTDAEFEALWQESKDRETREQAEFDALPEEDKKRLREMWSDPFYERISDDPTGDHDDD